MKVAFLLQLSLKIHCTCYLSHLVIYHNVMWLYIPVHDSHAVRVIQSLQIYQKYHLARIRARGKFKVIIILLPLEVHTSRNEYQNLLISGRDPINKK